MAKLPFNRMSADELLIIYAPVPGEWGSAAGKGNT
jgi:hypothetical protein